VPISLKLDMHISDRRYSETVKASFVTTLLPYDMALSRVKQTVYLATVTSSNLYKLPLLKQASDLCYFIYALTSQEWMLITKGNLYQRFSKFSKLKEQFFLSCVECYIDFDSTVS